MSKQKDNIITKVIRLKVVKLVSPTEDWIEMHKTIKSLQEEVRIASNSVLTACNMMYSSDSNLEEFKVKENVNKFKVNISRLAKDNCPNLQTGNTGSIDSELFSKYFKGNNSYVKMMEAGEGNPPMNFTNDIPIPIKNSNIKLIKTDNGYYNTKLSFGSRNFVSAWNETHEDKIKNGIFEFGLQVKRGQKEILERCMSGEYKICGSKFLRHRDKKYRPELCLNLTYSFVQNDSKDLDPEKICGVDLGIAIPAYCAVNYNIYSRFAINDSSIINEKCKLKNKTKQMQQALVYGALGDSGHGRKKKVTKLTKSKDKIANITNTKNYQWAKAIVDWAEKMGCGTIRVENLSGFNKRNATDKFLKHWTYFDLQMKIENKAKERGIMMEKVSPRYTSQCCSKCGHIDTKNRPKGSKGQSYFKCVKCGHEENADFNAAKNIASVERVQMSIKLLKNDVA